LQNLKAKYARPIPTQHRGRPRKDALATARLIESATGEFYFDTNGECSADIDSVVLDNLSTHSPGALYQAFPAPEAHRILRRPEFHYTPKHASWLNMVESEIGVLRTQCLDRRIDSRHLPEAEVAEWERQRNAQAARIK
jgi:hypothetical protein